jgi:hypothetical protein
MSRSCCIAMVASWRTLRDATECADQATIATRAAPSWPRIQASQSVPLGTAWSQNTSKPCATSASRIGFTRSRSWLE